MEKVWDELREKIITELKAHETFAPSEETVHVGRDHGLGML